MSSQKNVPPPAVDYRDKVLVAPMVRVSQLGFRTLCARQGSGPVFSEEIIAGKLVRCSRRVDVDRGIVEYYQREQRGPMSGGVVKETVVFSTLIKKSKDDYPEGAPLILQLGACDPETAVKATKLVEQDVDGVDLNMGCPRVVCAQKYDQGYGAALMSTPELACSILRALVANTNLPVSAKTRLMDTDEDALSLLRQLSMTGVHAITLHSRTREQKSREPAVHGRSKTLRETLGNDFPCALILNGDFTNCKEAMAFAKSIGFDGVMIGRGAMDNPTIFRAVPGTVLEGLQEAIRYHVTYGSNLPVLRYHLTRSMQKYDEHAPLAKKLYRAKDITAMCVVMGMTAEEGAVLQKSYVCPVRKLINPPDYVWLQHQCSPEDFPWENETE